MKLLHFLTVFSRSHLADLQEGLVINHHATNTLNSFGEWGQRQNKADDSDPDHYDHATLFTRYESWLPKSEYRKAV